MSERTTMTAAGRRRVRRAVLGAGLAGALVLGSATIAEAAGTPTPTPAASTAAPTATASATPTATPSASVTPTATPTPTPTTASPTPTPTPTATTPVLSGVLTIKGRTAGTGTNFSGTYAVQKGSALVPAQSRVVDLQRRTTTGWDTVQTDAADANGNLVFGTVRSHAVQVWRLVSEAATSDPDFAISSEIRVEKNGKVVSTVKFPLPGFRAGRHVGFNGFFTYRSWWITSGPDAGKQGFVAPLSTRVYLQYLSGGTWRTKTSVLTEDRKDAAVNAYFAITTQTSKPRVWRLYYRGSANRLPAVSASLTR